MDKQELIKEIIRLESEINKKEEELAAICEKEIQPLISAKSTKTLRDMCLISTEIV